MTALDARGYNSGTMSATPRIFTIICAGCSRPLGAGTGPYCPACAVDAVPLRREQTEVGQVLAGTCPHGCGESYWLRVNALEIECCGCGRRALPVERAS